ncbi:H-type small acid-soluble spore protein [Saliterribacillus persicus]|uniref:H-type small acid-soluble spore protein n=1 Tax=Saliterribacillus persicus TaxID=930114 RepID=A0A368YC58_9BACI|nr:H-type small acid-soluble spore protein [Saliterribacillus persicus]RCW76926.1 H-type small acid-soluble spore protein [Saliterribacillus persicus]
MNLMRAKEIKDDPVMQDVIYNGEYVYIQSVDDDRQIALVNYTKESEDAFEVDVTNLYEEN